MADKGKRKRGRPLFDENISKRNRSEVEASRNQTRIRLGKEADRWRLLKAELQIDSDVELATVLVNRYNETRRTAGPSTSTTVVGPATSTPIETSVKPTDSLTPVVSEISAAESTDEVTMSGVEEIAEEVIPVSHVAKAGSSKDIERAGSLDDGTGSLDDDKRHSKKALSASFVDPCQLTLDISEVQEEDDIDDPSYIPEYDITIMPEGINDDIDELAFEEAEFGQEIEREGDTSVEQMEELEEEVGPGLKRMKTEGDCEELLDDRCCLAYVGQLVTLANTVREKCSLCQSRLSIETECIGSAVYLKWICPQKHIEHKWCSQPIMNRRLHSGDLLIASACVMSGNNYGKLSLWSKMLNLAFPSASVFHRIQNCYIVPAIDKVWDDHQTEVIEGFQGEELILMGDGRMDSPGHCAQYCSYTFMEFNTKKVICLATMDKRVVDRKSSAMEKAAFQNSLQGLKDRGVNIKEVVTDGHMGIACLMKKTYPEIKHSHDIWHVAKNLGKRITKAGLKKGCKDVLQWAKHIVNHFWYACGEAGSYSRFINIWGQVRHHVCNEHDWILADGDGPAECSHGDLEADPGRPSWISKETLASKAVTGIVLDKKLRSNFSYYENFRSTAEIEVFNNLIIMYCAKRFAYSPPAYRIRNLLASLDNNHHIDRPLKLNKKGEIVYHRSFNKKSGRWSVYPCKEEKKYQYVKDILSKILVTRLQDKVGMHKPRTLEVDDPRRIGPHLAPVSPKPSKEIALEQKSRRK